MSRPRRRLHGISTSRPRRRRDSSPSTRGGCGDDRPASTRIARRPLQRSGRERRARGRVDAPQRHEHGERLVVAAGAPVLVPPRDVVRDARVRAEDRDERRGGELDRRPVASALPACREDGRLHRRQKVLRERPEEVERPVVGGVEPGRTSTLASPLRAVHGLSTWHPAAGATTRRRNIHAAAAAPPRRVRGRASVLERCSRPPETPSRGASPNTRRSDTVVAATYPGVPALEIATSWPRRRPRRPARVPRRRRDSLQKIRASTRHRIARVVPAA